MTLEDDPHIADIIYPLYLEQMRDFGSPPLPIEYFKFLLKQKNAVVFLAWIQNNPAAFLFAQVFGNVMYADINSGSKKYKKYFPKVKLFKESISYSCSNKQITRYNFMRTRKDTGVFEHKKKWGAEQSDIFYSYFYYKKKNKFNFDPDSLVFNLPRKIIRILPLSLLQNIGPGLRIEMGI